MAKKTTKKNEEKQPALAGISTRGRTFEGTVTRVFPKRITIEFERTVYIKKYERYSKKRTRIHSRLPDDMDIKIGDYVRVKECRPLSKLIHSIVVEKLRDAEDISKEAKK